jgi:hypothetical protein
MYEKPESLESRIVDILYFIENEEENDSNILHFKCLLSELGSAVHDIRIAFKQSNLMTLVGFCFLQKSLKIKFVNSILGMSPTLLIAKSPEDKINGEYFLVEKDTEGVITLKRLNYWQPHLDYITPLEIAAILQEDLTRLDIIFQHQNHIKELETKAGCKAFIHNYIRVLMQCKQKEILVALKKELRKLALFFGSKGDISLLKKCLRIVHSELEELDSREACQKIYSTFSKFITDFETGCSQTGFMKSILNKAVLLGASNAIKEYKEFGNQLIPQRDLENQVLNILHFIQEKEPSEANIIDFKYMLRGLNCNISEIVVKQWNWMSLAGFCFSSGTRFKPEFLDCILDIDPNLLIQEQHIFKYSLSHYGLHALTEWPRIRLVEPPSHFRNMPCETPILKAIYNRSSTQINAILNHPKLAELAKTRRWEVLEWKLRYYVQACVISWNQGEKNYHYERNAQAFNFAGMLKEAVILGFKKEKMLLKRFEEWLNEYSEELEEDFKNKINLQTRKPIKKTFNKGFKCNEVAPQATLLLMVKNKMRLDCDTNTNLTIASNTNLSNNTGAMEEMPMLQYVGDALTIGLDKYVMPACPSKIDRDGHTHH